MCACMCVCIKVEFSYGGATQTLRVWLGTGPYEKSQEVKSCSVSAGRAKKEGANSQGKKRPDRGYSNPKKAQTHVTLKNSTGWTNDGLEEPVEKLRTFSFSSTS